MGSVAPSASARLASPQPPSTAPLCLCHPSPAGLVAGPAHLGLLTWGAVGQSRFMWRARTARGVIEAFETCWDLQTGGALLVSFDGAALFRPPQLQPGWQTRPALQWLHVDQGAGKRGMAGVQGQLLLYDQTPASGGLVLVPRSHRRHAELVLEHRCKKDFVSFGPGDARLAGLGDARLICARAGDLILWDSRTVHASDPADPSSPLPLDDDSRPRLARCAALITMVPAAPHIAANPALPSRRASLVRRACTMTHWPQEATEATLVSRGVPGPNVFPSVDALSPHGRALVLGTPRV
jgi:hypothetical protein